MGSLGGLRGRTQAVIHPVFQNRLTELKARALANYNAFRNLSLREWDLPTELLTDLFDIESLHKPAHDRTTINTNYETLVRSLVDPGTTGDGISLAYQADYLAAEERALRVRHTNLCRSAAHAAARRFGQANGRVFDAVREQAEKMIQVGGGQR